MVPASPSPRILLIHKILFITLKGYYADHGVVLEGRDNQTLYFFPYVAMKRFIATLVSLTST